MLARQLLYHLSHFKLVIFLKDPNLIYITPDYNFQRNPLNAHRIKVSSIPGPS
jgi:hypothetical protein